MMKAARQAIIDTIADRLDAAEDEWIDADERDDEQPEVWVCTRGTLEFVKRMIFQELFAARPKPKQATNTAPGSPDRIEEMARRMEAGEDLYHDDDATPQNTGKALNIQQRKNGGRRGGNTTAPDDSMNQKVMGWQDEDEDEG